MMVGRVATGELSALAKANKCATRPEGAHNVMIAVGGTVIVAFEKQIEYCATRHFGQVDCMVDI
ncbi:hypothetical protein FOMPIDRAFT_1022876 [Fomitopsis schrenkii]|uniref:Uncharacterized protein n=1 Tax=Fomitopsis schrenkii TaxID=2126942 RepID=S8ED82_FOMSC|nr:hypothetical protein FOMPIDRAFT_1022876 [Fomitopsis schrenkii]